MATHTSAFQLTSLDSAAAWHNLQPASAAAVPSVSLPFGLPQVLAIMTALAAFNPDAAATMQFINTELLDQLAQGTPLGEAMVNVSLLLSPPAGGDLSSPLSGILTQIGPMIALAPNVISGAITVLAAIPEAALPVLGAVVDAFIKTAAAAGSDGFAAAAQAGITEVVTAAAKGIAMMVDVVRNVLQSISATLTGGSAAATMAPAAVRALRAPSGLPAAGDTTKVDTSTTRATASPTSARGVAGARPRHSSPAAGSATATANSRPSDSTRARDARPTGNKGTAESAR
ncbi:hypothetical protein [Mycolicibacterium aromaticivorans]|uniref:hypothetical protein n=1 Tax=Mycolicibacterium aromaticivorans TaxID=318425 RepID=UPI0004B7AA80|nr:hypothetical protein [Mycolicibacterium aromaticivorans]